MAVDKLWTVDIVDVKLPLIRLQIIVLLCASLLHVKVKEANGNPWFCWIFHLSLFQSHTYIQCNRSKRCSWSAVILLISFAFAIFNYRLKRYCMIYVVILPICKAIKETPHNSYLVFILFYSIEFHEFVKS